MTSIIDAAKAYEPQRTKNIADLEAVSTMQEIKTEVRTTKKKDKDGNEYEEEYKVSFVVVEGEEYRVPNTVLEQLQTIVESKPDLKTFKVDKKGEGLNTKYTVVQLE